MISAAENIFHRFIVCLLLFFTVTTLSADDGGILSRRVEITKNKGTVYQLLKQLSDQSGYLFIYDSQIIDNNKTIKIRKGNYTLGEAIYAITQNERLKINVVGNHILLRLDDNKEEQLNLRTVPAIETEKEPYFTISGKVYDRITNEPIVYSSVSINYTTINTVTNQSGEFRLIIPDSLNHSVVKFSHVGYDSQEIEAYLLDGQYVSLSLDPRVIPLQEVVVRAVDPLKELQNMKDSIKENYSSEPVLLTAFYREGIDYKKKNIDLTESVLQIYKTGYHSKPDKDQTKLIKMRRIVSKQEKDTIFTKMKSGIYSTLVLDIIKDLPDFITLGENTPYEYRHTDITTIDDRRVNVISFEQPQYVKEPLYKGELYIDADNSALTEARFEINPQFVEKATGWFIERKSRDIKLSLQEAKYVVSYRPSDDDKYYVSHIRGDIQFKVRKKGRWFSSPLHIWFEMVNCKTDTENVKTFNKKERLSPHKVFSETKYRYDKSFWGHFNVILPEEKLKETILNNLNEVTETVSN
ncbi:carboxypeptidase-like regulatory domain-containing protein [Dysgonomonas sp. Marseille-P4677]|uniref:carboxypeptidase-like regulatory domain-containing protein n=1 Tax=Dysgonomonas sp. Marseille-P4677 TaxID=2364790 RepID=UPI001914B3B2|nr:carboxypeptidase-like regulatory domain-containing protein [Dysgonomonas sp. Marseille-P4677]MBK5720898.1 carboxypeptidase-like regulatory domain-containing protein [Dysgonomonas sp. Marseille-P4677]